MRARDFTGGVPVGGGVEVHAGGGRLVEGGVEEPKRFLLPQHALHGAVHDLHGNAALVDGAPQRLEVRIAAWELDVHAGCEGLAGGIREVVGQAMQHLEEGDAEVVGDHHSIEAPLPT